MATVYKSIFTGPEIDAKLSERVPSTPSGSPLHDLFVAAGAVWNPNTKFWEYKDLLDITTSQMVAIYNTSIGRFSSTDLYCAFQGANIRTNLYRITQLGAIYGTYINAAAAFASSTIEIANLGQVCYPEHMSGMFSNAAALRKINGYLYVNYLKSEDSLRNAFAGTTKLEEIRLRGLRFNISFADSPLISLVSMQHLIANAANTSTITVIVHPAVYSKLTDSSQTDWYAVNTAAQAKQISFATA